MQHKEVTNRRDPDARIDLDRKKVALVAGHDEIGSARHSSRKQIIVEWIGADRNAGRGVHKHRPVAKVLRSLPAMAGTRRSRILG